MNKYHAQKTTVDGKTFALKLAAEGLTRRIKQIRGENHG